MYTRHIIFILNPICIFLFAFKRTLTSFKLFFIIIKTHVVNMIKFVLIIIIFQKFRCFFSSTYFFSFMGQDFIHRTINSGIIFLLLFKFISWYRIIPTVLSRINFHLLITKGSHDLAFI